MPLPLPHGSDRSRTLLIFAVFVVFAIHALGLVDFSALATGGPALHPQSLSDLLAGRVPGTLGRLDVLAFLGLGIVLAVLLPLMPPIGASLLTLVAMVPPFLTAWYFPVPPPLVPLEYTLLTILVLFAVNVLSSYFVETHQRQRIIAAFGQYVPPALVGEISRDPDAFSMAGSTRELTVLFCDIKQFTTLAETLDARELTELLNDYLTAMTDVLHAHGATIDKYIGDAIMAFWGAPVAQPDHATRAVTAALAMQADMVALRRRYAARGWPLIEIGIGIASGQMHVGNMGSRYRVAYTVIGDAVNLAARLEALTRLYGIDILVSAATQAACRTVAYREIDYVRVKGRASAQRIYEPIPVDHADNGRLARHHAALAAYYAGDWARAASDFAQLAADSTVPGYYSAMLERVHGHSRPADWDGTVTFGGESNYSLGVSGAREA